jgi:hypothetical protein
MRFELVDLIGAGIRIARLHTGRLPSWVILFAIGTMLIGCRERGVTWDDIDRPKAIADLTRIAERHWLPEQQERAKAALLELRNTVVDTKPIFVCAMLAFEDPNEFRLWFTCFDEGRDLRGIRLREQQEDVKGIVTTLEEDYPIFLDLPKSLTVEQRLIPVRIRDAHQRKDELSWLRYENYRLNALIQETLAKDKRNASGTALRQMPDMEMPPIYVSIPDPNRVRVEICAYDRAGQKSDWIEVDCGASMTLYGSNRANQAPK